MGLWARRLLAQVAVAAALLISPAASAVAETVAPSPGATASATPSRPAEPDDKQTEDTPDAELDDTRTILALVGAGALALLAGVVVFVRR